MTVTTSRPARLLRLALILDGVATGLTGAALTALAGVLDGPLGAPAGALLGVGVFFLLYGVAVLVLGTRAEPPRRGAVAVIVINLLYVLDSVLLAALGIGDLTAFGVVVVLVLAGAVAGLAGLQLAGLHRTGPE